MDIIQADYAALAQIARDFGQQMAAIEDVQGQIQRGYSPLQAGGWLGRGVATADQKTLRQQIERCLNQVAPMAA